MTHLTLTGPYAGRPLCDCNRELCTLKGDTFQHVDFSSDNQFDSTDTCPVCVTVALTIDDDDATATRQIEAARKALAQSEARTAHAAAGQGDLFAEED